MRISLSYNDNTMSKSKSNTLTFEETLIQSKGRAFVFDDGDLRTLHFDGNSIQSAMSISSPDRLILTYTQAMMAFLLFNPAPAHILLIGLGGGSLAKYCYQKLPDTCITVVELDKDVIALRDVFHVQKDDHRFQVIQSDALDFIETTSEKFDFILHDGFVADGLAPALSTESFYQSCHQVLCEGGALISNLWGNHEVLFKIMLCLHTIFDEQLWWCNARNSLNRILISGKNIDVNMTQSGFSGNAALLDGQHQFSFSDIARRLHTTTGKSRADFDAFASNYLCAA